MKKAANWFISALGVLLCAAGLYLAISASDPQGVMKTLPYLCIGGGCGLFGYGVAELISSAVKRNNKELAKQIEIEQKDERNQMLANLAKAKGFGMMTYVFAALMMVYALMGASIGVVLPFVGAYLFVQGYALYCRVRLEKEK